MRDLVKLVTVLFLFWPLGSSSGQDFSAIRKSPWTTSNIRGTPEPPLPYKTSRVFPKLRFNNLLEVRWVPTAEKWVATQLDGRIFTFNNDRQNAEAKLLLDLNDLHEKPVYRGFSATFHHDLENHPWCYVYYASEKSPHGMHLARFKVTDPTVPTIDKNSHTVLATWSSDGHAGSSMHFGPDGYLYISVGDGQPPYPPDPLNVSQDLSVLQGSILRIDVDNPTVDEPYRIPPDNPFVGQENARGEIWAYGFRNPWKMSFHPKSGELYVGDIGWEMREMIHRVKPGANYGWSIMEGSQRVKGDLQPTTEITPPLFQHTHVDSRSITGGYFWQSERFPELKDAYIYGDWMTGKVWALKAEGDKLLWQKELADTQIQIICFMQNETGEVLLVGYDGTILRLEENPVKPNTHDFPTRLSQTGLFADAIKQRPAEGVVEYEISAHHWADGTHSRQWIGVPDTEQLSVFDQSRWEVGQREGRFQFPLDTVVAKTVSYFSQVDEPSSERHIETQVLHKAGDEWRAYNYVWNDEQTDAILQDDVASERPLTIQDASVPTGSRTQTWHHSSRSECLLCHIWSAGTIHGFDATQLNIAPDGTKQLAQLESVGLFKEPVPRKQPIPSPHDESVTLEDRARSYLDLNCATCHRPNGGGTADFNFVRSSSLTDNNYVGAKPAQGEFGLTDARILSPGHPFRSVLLYRAIKTGRGHMPQFGSKLVDRRGVELLHDWIASMSESEQLINDGLLPFNSGVSDEELSELLDSSSNALELSYLCVTDELRAGLRQRVARMGAARNEPTIRDLFEAYLPDEQRIKRLGTIVDEEALLAMEGSVERGEHFFENAKDVNCRNCHRIGTAGQSVGPDLSSIGRQLTKEELLASILRPSESIDKQYRTRIVLTVDGRVISGVIVEDKLNELILADAAGKLQSVKKVDIDTIQASSTSVMPNNLLTGMGVQQAADLLAFLNAQRKLQPLQHRRAKIRRTEQPIVIDGKFDDTWRDAETVGDFVFTWWEEGGPEQQQTQARMLWDDQYLYVSFQCDDKNIVATATETGGKVWLDDCVEVFASPEMDAPENYFNLEINALGTHLINYRPNGGDYDRNWEPKGIKIAVEASGTVNDSSDTDQSWNLEVAIPFSILPNVIPKGSPQVGDRWRLNLNRLEDEMAIKSQWSQGDQNIPKFHNPDSFGFVEFVK